MTDDPRSAVAYRSTPPEQSWPAHAAIKIKAAERREADARRMRAEAAELLRLWDAYVAGRDSVVRVAS
jgi:hypothetical protein